MRLASGLGGAAAHLVGGDAAFDLRELRAALRSARRGLKQDQLQRRLARTDPALRARIEADLAALPPRPSVGPDPRG